MPEKPKRREADPQHRIKGSSGVSEPTERWFPCGGSGIVMTHVHWQRIWRGRKSPFLQGCSSCGVKRTFLTNIWYEKGLTTEQLRQFAAQNGMRLVENENIATAEPVFMPYPVREESNGGGGQYGRG